MSLKLLMIDIDGLRGDVFADSLAQGLLPQISRALGGTGLEKGLQLPVLAPAPSITFTSQASLFSGMHPSQHGIPGNQFFDRFGTHSKGRPRHYAFDVGDTLSGDDAVKVFAKGLAADCLLVPTIYERFGDWGWRSVVAGNMYAKGADTWIKPSLLDIARFTKGGNLFGLDSATYDQNILDDVLDEIAQNGLPDVLTVYFMGLDHESHHHGPGVQRNHLEKVIDPMVGELWDSILSIGPEPSSVVAVFSDHGQTRVVPDDDHSLRLAFPFEKEIGHLFDALGLDVHDYPGEDPDCDALVASNGGLAQVYLQNRSARWADAPAFERDVQPVGHAFWEAHKTGSYAPELHGALAGVLVRNVQEDGWYAGYKALTPDGQLIALEDWFFPSSPSGDLPGTQQYADPVNRLNNLSSPYVGDLLLISNYADGYYFGAPTLGIHGGLHPEDSSATLVFGFPGSSDVAAKQMSAAVSDAIRSRCQAEGGRQPSTTDLLTGLLAVLRN